MELNVKAVRLAMIEMGYNITSLSRVSGIGTATLNNWLNHGTTPQLGKIGQLARALDVPITEIIIQD